MITRTSFTMLRLTTLLLLFCSCEFILANKVTQLRNHRKCGCGQPFGSELVQFVTKRNYFQDGLYWDNVKGEMLFARRKNQTLCRYSEKTGKTQNLRMPELGEREISAVFPARSKPNQYVVFANQSAYKLTLKNKNHTIEKIMTVDTGDNQILSRATVCPVGGVIIGTAPKNYRDANHQNGTAKILYVNLKKKTTKVLSQNYDIVSGVALNKHNDKLYVADYGKQQLFRYKVNASKDDISLYDKKLIFDISKYDKGFHGKINSITMDKESNLYISMEKAKQALVFDCHRRIVTRIIPLTVSHSTDIKWGGRNRDTLFIGSTKINVNVKQEPAAGKLIAVTGLGPRGVKINRVALP